MNPGAITKPVASIVFIPVLSKFLSIKDITPSAIAISATNAESLHH